MDRKNFNPQVGDLVRVRDWDDMEHEFGVFSNGNIRCEFVFTKGMKHLCGSEFIITEIRNGRYTGLETDLSISKDMIEPVDDVDENVFEEIEEFLSGITVRK